MIKGLLFFIVIGLMLGSGIGSAQEKPAYIPVTRFDPRRDAAKDIQNATVEAERTGKRILLDVGGDWCVWCRRLDTLFVANKDLAETLQKEYVVVKVNWSKENKNEAVLSRYPEIPGVSPPVCPG